MTKVMILTDTHWGVRNDSPIFLDYFKRTMDEFVLPYIREHNIKHVIHAGDLVDRRKYINVNTAHRLRTDFLEPMNELVTMHVIAGNHDEYYKDTYRVNALDEFVSTRYPNTKTYSTPTTITIDDSEFFLLPWITKESEQDSIDAINNSKAPVCIGHLELDGFEMQKGMLADHGYDAKIFRRFDHVLTGHYHHRSVRDNIHYIGALCEHIWSDYNDPRGFVVYDTATRVLDFQRNPFRVYHMVSYDDVKHKDIVEKINASDYSKFKDCYVKVVCVNKTNPYAFDVLLDKLYKEQPADISIVEDVNSFTDNNLDELIDEAQDTMTILDNYVSGLTLPVEPDRMKHYMREIYAEALSLENIE
jgi:DNA repair exonuclease SbcCD nuclease subunit